MLESFYLSEEFILSPQELGAFVEMIADEMLERLLTVRTGNLGIGKDRMAATTCLRLFWLMLRDYLGLHIRWQLANLGRVLKHLLLLGALLNLCVEAFNLLVLFAIQTLHRIQLLFQLLYQLVIRPDIVDIVI